MTAWADTGEFLYCAADNDSTWWLRVGDDGEHTLARAIGAATGFASLEAANTALARFEADHAARTGLHWVVMRIASPLRMSETAPASPR
jgi:hypothetical protein